ncbi:MAG: hypothetical protein IJ374_04100 [Lachnospiraceae bacterium]|nr:hypothetical protein [Lachnospiraceae bacterium]
MSLILCRQEPVTSPYFIEELGIHIYSSQELCYVIYNHPLLVMEDFVDVGLAEFLRSELRMPFLAERIEKWLDGRGASDELLFLILQECAYYSPQEQARYRQAVTNLRKISVDEYAKRRADYHYSLGLYGRAISMYEKILDAGKEKHLSGEFKSRIWNNIAACYTKLFCFQKAMYAYDCAWNEKSEKAYLKRMYFLTLMEPELEMKDRYKELIEKEDTCAWDVEAQGSMDEAANSSEVIRLQQLFEKDPIKRISGAGEIINDWKYQYRKMI